MKFKLRPKRIDAFRWKGWPHKIKGLVDHPIYGQCAAVDETGCTVYQGDWVLRYPCGSMEVWNEVEFAAAYEPVKPKTYAKKKSH